MTDNERDDLLKQLSAAAEIIRDLQTAKHYGHRGRQDVARQYRDTATAKLKHLPAWLQTQLSSAL